MKSHSHIYIYIKILIVYVILITTIHITATLLLVFIMYYVFRTIISIFGFDRKHTVSMYYYCQCCISFCCPAISWTSPLFSSQSYYVNVYSNHYHLSMTIWDSCIVVSCTEPLLHREGEDICIYFLYLV